MALLTPDNLIILNFVFVTFLKYHLRNLSFLGYSQCLFLGQRRPTHSVTMPYYLFSFRYGGSLLLLWQHLCTELPAPFGSALSAA